jgi:hypothetical protein
MFSALVATMALAGVAAAQAPQTGQAEPRTGGRSAVADDDVGTAPVDRRYDPLEMVCKKTKPRTGSRVVRDRGDQRICMTRAQWEHVNNLAQDVMRERDRGQCGSGCGVPK